MTYIREYEERIIPWLGYTTALAKEVGKTYHEISLGDKVLCHLIASPSANGIAILASPLALAAHLVSAIALGILGAIRQSQDEERAGELFHFAKEHLRHIPIALLLVPIHLFSGILYPPFFNAFAESEGVDRFLRPQNYPDLIRP